MKRQIIFRVLAVLSSWIVITNSNAHSSEVQRTDDVYMHKITIEVTERDIETAIRKCNDGFDISTTASMAESTFKTSDCLDELLIKLMKTFTTQDASETKEQLKQLRASYVSLKSNLFSNYRGCNGACGSMWSGMGTSYYNTLLEEMALDVIRHHEFY